MSFRARRLAALLVFASLAGLPPWRPAHSAPLVDCVTRDAWVVANTRHVILYTNAPADDAKSLATEFARFSWLLGEQSPGLADDGGSPVIAFAFKDAACYEPFRMRFAGKAVTGPGHYVAGPLGGMIVFAFTFKPEDLRVVHHEYLHAFTVEPMRNVPPCLREGLAELYSTFQFANGTAVFGHALPGWCWVMQHQSPLPLAELLGTGAGEQYYAGAERDMIYAEGWALVEYLNRKYSSEKLDAFIAAVNAGTDPLTAFHATYPGENADDLPKRLRDGLAECEVDAVTVPVGKDFTDDALTVRPAPPAEIETAIGDLLFQEGRTGADEAQAYYDAALKADPAYAPALVGFGMLNSARGFRAQALPLYQRALASPALDPTHLAWAARGLLNDTVSDTTVHDNGATLIRKLKDIAGSLDRAIATEPPRRDAMEIYAAATIADSAFAAQAAPRLAGLHARWPRRGDIAYALLSAELHMGACDRADTLVAQATFAGRSESQMEDSRGEICRCHMIEAARFARAGQEDEAQAALTRASAIAPTDEMRGEVTEMTQRFASNRDRNLAVDLYNGAVALVRAGQIDKAMAEFEVVREKAADPELVLAAGQRIDDLKKFKAARAATAHKR
jgi:tetratricopeptide (TPR) repeat protein